MAKVVNGGHLADHVLPWCFGAAAFGVVQSVIHHWKPAVAKWIPNPVALAVVSTAALTSFMYHLATLSIGY